MNECTTNSYSYTSSPIQATSDTVLWVNGDIPCLNICNNTRLSEVEAKIANKICDLITLTDVTSIILPDCFITAFGTQDENILNFLNFLLQIACNQQNAITNLPTSGTLDNLNPNVTIDLTCCADNPCVTTGTMRLSAALQSVINCLCDLKSQVTTTNTRLDDLETLVNSVSIIANQANVNATDWITNKPTINNDIATLTSRLDVCCP